MHSISCACVGPQKGERKCPCRMRMDREVAARRLRVPISSLKPHTAPYSGFGGGVYDPSESCWTPCGWNSPFVPAVRVNRKGLDMNNSLSPSHLDRTLAQIVSAPHPPRLHTPPIIEHVRDNQTDPGESRPPFAWKPLGPLPANPNPFDEALAMLGPPSPRLARLLSPAEPLDASSISARLLHIVANQYEHYNRGHASDVTPDSTWASLQFDSLDRIEIAMAIEDTFDLELPDDVIETLSSITSATVWLVAELAGRDA